MPRLTDILGKPRTMVHMLESGITVTIRELSLADTWPYINGEAVDPTVLIRASLINDLGEPAIAPQDEIPMRQALELVPVILEFNGLTSEDDNDEDDGGEDAQLEEDFPRAVPGD